MSRTIDERVVSLEFDNSNFEKNVKTSMSTLDKLKAKLNFGGATAGLDELEKASKKFDVSPMENGLDAITKRFSTLGIVGMRVIENITDSIYRSSTAFLTQVSGINNATAGWAKYEEQTKAVQSILSAVSTKINETSGELYNTDDVYDTIKRLSWYADETSYNMEQMTNAVASFTSTGMDLKAAEDMIQGIANACALAGVDARKAEHAFQGFSKAIGSGSVNKNLWNTWLKTSGITANEQFMQSCLDAAVAVGTLKDAVNGYYTTTSKAAKAGETFNIGSFAEALTDGGWLTTDVLTETFKSYMGDMSHDLSEVFQMYDSGKFSTTSEAIADLIKQYNDAGQQIPKWLRSFQAAQEAITSTQAIESVQTAAQSAWGSIYASIFGNIDEQRKTWSKFANDLYAIFVDPIWSIQEAIEAAFGSSGLGQIQEYLQGAYEKLNFEDLQGDLSRYIQANDEGFDKLINKYGSLEKIAENNSEYVATWLSRYLNSVAIQSSNAGKAIEAVEDKIARFQKAFDGVWNGDYGSGAERVKQLEEAGYIYDEVQLKLINKFGPSHKITAEDVAELTDAELDAIGATEEEKAALSELRKELSNTDSDLNTLMKSIGKRKGRELLSETIGNITDTIINFQKIASTAFSSVFSIDTPGIIYNIVESIHNFSEELKNATDWINLLSDEMSENDEKAYELAKSHSALYGIFRTIGGVLKVVSSGFSLVKEVISQLIEGGLKVLGKLFGDLNLDFSGLTDSFSESIDNFTKWLSENKTIVTTIETITENIKNVLSEIGSYFSQYIDLSFIKDGLKTISDFITTARDSGSITKVFTNFGDSVAEAFTKLKNADPNTIAENINGFFSNIGKYAENAKNDLGKSLDGIMSKLKFSEENIEAFKTEFKKLSEVGIGFGAGYLVIQSIGKLGDSFSTLIKPMTMLSNVMSSFAGAGAAIGGYFNQLKANAKTDQIIRIAIAVAILTASLTALVKLTNGDYTALLLSAAVIAVMSGAIYFIAQAANALADSMTKDKAEGIKSFGILLIALAGSIFVLALAARQFDQVQNGWQTGLLMVGSVTALVLAYWALSKIVKGHGKEVVSISKTLLAIAGSLYLVGLSLEKLDKIKLNDVWKTLGLLLVSVISLVAITSASKNIGKFNGLSIIMFAASLYVIALAIEKVANMPVEQYIKGLLGFIPLFAALTILMKAMNGVSITLKGLGVTFIGIAAGLLIMGFAIEKLSSLKSSDIKKALEPVKSIMLWFSGVMAVLSLASGKAGAARQIMALGVLALTLSASLYLMVGVIYILKNIEQKDLDKAVNAIEGMLLALGMALMLAGLGTADINKVNMFSKIVVMIGILAAAMFALSFIPVQSLWAVAGVFGAVFGSLAILMTALNFYAKTTAGNFGAEIFTMVSAIGMVATLVVALIALENNIKDADKAVAMAESLSKMMIALSSAMLIVAAASAVFAGIGTIGVGAGSLAALGGLTLAIGAIAVFLGECLREMDWLTFEVMDEIILWVGKFGELIGTVFGSILGGLIGSFAGATVDSASKLMAEAADNLNKLGESLKTFSEISFDENSGSNINSVVEFVKLLGNRDFVNSLKGLSGKNVDFEKLGTFLTNYSAAMVDFSANLKGINARNVDAAANAGKMYTELVKNLPREDNWFTSLFLGKQQTLEQFGKNLSAFATSLVDVSFKFKRIKITEEELNNVSGLTSTFIDLENAMSKQDGIWQKIIGESDIGDFGGRLKDFASSIHLFVQKMKGIDKSELEDAKTAAQDVAELFTTVESSLVSNNSLKGWIFGENKSLSDFGSRITKFVESIGEAMKGFILLKSMSKETGEITAVDSSIYGLGKSKLVEEQSNEDIFEYVKNIIEKVLSMTEGLADLEEKMSSGSFEFFGLNSELSNFGTSMSVLASGVREFVTKIKDLTYPTDDDLASIEKLINTIIRIGSTTEGETDINTVADNVNALSNPLKNFGDSIQSIVSSFTNISSLGIDTGAGGGFLESISSMFGNTAFQETVLNPEDATATASSYLNSITTVFSADTGSSALGKLKSSATDMATSLLTIFDQKEKMTEIGNNLLAGLSNGIAPTSDNGYYVALMSNVHALADSIISSLQFSWELHSPSRVTYRLGEFLIQGLANGIKDMTGDAVDTTESMALSVSTALENALATSDDVLNDQFSPVITPVLDLSAVQTGANSISSMLDTGASYQAALAVNGMQSTNAANQNSGRNNINVNLDFNVNGVDVGSVTRETFQGWASWIVDALDEELGKRI